MSQVYKNVSSDMTSSPFHFAADTERPISDHPGLINYFSEYTGIWRHGHLPGFTLTLHAQDGTGRIEIVDDLTGEIPLPPNPFGEDEKIFAGWSYTAEGEIITTPTILIEKNTSLFACWRERDKYFLTYDLMGGSGGPEPQEKIEKIPLIISSIIPTFTENTFLGWSTSPFSQEVSYKPGDKYNIDGNSILYAVWSHNTYKITFYSNGGYGSMPAVSGVYGIYYLPECKYGPPKGKTFAGWSYESYGFPIASREIFVERNTKLYAIWVQGDFVVTYDLEGGTPAIAYQIKKKGIDLKLSSVIPTKEGYTFKGWCIDDSGIPDFQPGDTYNIDQSVCLIAVWEPNGYLIKYDANGGTNPPATQTKTPGVPITITTKEPTRYGYLFLGWALYKTGSVAYHPGDIYSEDKDLNLFAVWKELRFKVYYDSNGGSGEMEPADVGVGMFVLPPCTFTPPTGSYFLGWSEKPDSLIIIKSVEVTTSDRTVYAVWKSVTNYTITYDANGGIGAPEPQKKEAKKPITLSSKIPVFEHHVFQGWSDSPTGAVLYRPGDTYSLDANITLYAIWRWEQFTLTFDANGGTGSEMMPPVIMNYGKNSIPGSKFIPPKDNRFAGWSLSPTDINLITEVFMDGNKTVYAIWTDQTKFLITYDLNGAPESEEKLYPPQYKQYLYPLKLSNRIPNYSEDRKESEKWLFLGWEDSNGKRYNPSSYYHKEMDTPMTAQWHEIIYYPVIFLPNGGDGYMEPLDTFGMITLPDCAYTPPAGTEFIGWALGPYDDLLPEKIKIASKVVLYAIYE